MTPAVLFELDSVLECLLSLHPVHRVGKLHTTHWSVLAQLYWFIGRHTRRYYLKIVSQVIVQLSLGMGVYSEVVQKRFIYPQHTQTGAILIQELCYIICINFYVGPYSREVDVDGIVVRGGEGEPALITNRFGNL